MLPNFLLCSFLLVVTVIEIPKINFSTMPVWEVIKGILVIIVLLFGIVLFFKK